MTKDAAESADVVLPLVYSAIGLALTHAQSTEALLKMVTTFVIPNKSHTWDSYQTLSATEKKKTLGYFIGLVKSRTKLYPKLEDMLSEFLQARNDFVHNPSIIPGWNLQTVDGRGVAERYCLQFMYKALHLQHVFMALTEEWASEIGMNVEVAADVREYFETHVDPLRLGVQELFAHGDFVLKINRDELS